MNIYFIERRMNKARIEHLKTIATNSGIFTVCSDIKDASVLLAQESTAEQVTKFLSKKKAPNNTLSETQTLVDISWFIQCMKDKKVLQIKENHKLKVEDLKKNLILSTSQELELNSEAPPSKKLCSNALSSVSKYACQTPTPLTHFNKKFCDALEILEQHALFRDDANSAARALAFRRGSASLKSFNREVTCEEDLKSIPYVGSSKAGHCRKIVIEMLTEGVSDEVECIINSKFYQSMKIFCGIFGVGPSTARKWFYDLSLCTLEDVKRSSINLNQDQKLGLEYYEDLNTPVSLEEAKCILKLVEEACSKIDHQLTVTLVGGFRRGKLNGHDVDLMISHPESPKESGVLPSIIDQLKKHFIYSDKRMLSQAGSKESDSVHSTSTMDHFDKCFGILRFNYAWLNTFHENLQKDWKAVRVDLIVVPHDQFAFALLGWTGTKHFEREIRRYSKTERQIVLTSHGMYSSVTKEHFSASSETEIFQQLGLEYRPPCERCC